MQDKQKASEKLKSVEAIIPTGIRMLSSNETPSNTSLENIWFLHKDLRKLKMFQIYFKRI
jgi:hypothetical protein